MAMNPRTHPRGAPPDFSMAGLPPVPKYTTPALWWLVQMRLRLEPKSKNGGTYAYKRQYHNTGQKLLDHRDENGQAIWANDPSIRRTPDKTGPWWRNYCAAHDWTFDGAHTGDYTEIKKYCNRLRNAMRDPKDLRPDDVYAYFIGQINNDRIVEGYNEYEDDEESGDTTHLWHRHDSFRRNIIGLFSAMWKALTIDMGWTYAEYLESVEDKVNVADADVVIDRMAARLQANKTDDDFASQMKAVPWRYNGGGLQGATTTLDALSDSQHIMKAVSDLTALVVQQSGQTAEAIAAALAPLILAGLPDTNLTTEDVETAVKNVLRSGVGS